MRFGLRLIPHAGDTATLIRLAIAADEAGFDQIWLPQDAFMPNARALSVAIAAHTHRIEVGAMSDPYGTDPAELATYATTLDEISNGRALIGLGLHTHETLAWTGQDATQTVDRVRETAELTRALISGEVAQHAGATFQWSEDCYLRFKPLRNSIPLYVMPVGAELLQLSGAIGDGSLPRLIPPRAASELVTQIRKGATAAGRNPDEVDIAACVWLCLSEKSQEPPESLRRMVSYFGPLLEADVLGLIGLTLEDFAPVRALVANGRIDEAAARVTDEMLQLSMTGTLTELVSQIEDLRSEGVTQLNAGGPLGADPEQAIRLIGRHVIPYFRDSA